MNVELPWVTRALMGLACRSRGPAGLVAWLAALGAISFLVRRWRATEARKALWALVVLVCWTGLFVQAVGRPIFLLEEQLNRDDGGVPPTHSGKLSSM